MDTHTNSNCYMPVYSTMYLHILAHTLTNKYTTPQKDKDGRVSPLEKAVNVWKSHQLDVAFVTAQILFLFLDITD